MQHVTSVKIHEGQMDTFSRAQKGVGARGMPRKSKPCSLWTNGNGGRSETGPGGAKAARSCATFLACGRPALGRHAVFGGGGGGTRRAPRCVPRISQAIPGPALAFPGSLIPTLCTACVCGPPPPPHVPPRANSFLTRRAHAHAPPPQVFALRRCCQHARCTFFSSWWSALPLALAGTRPPCRARARWACPRRRWPMWAAAP